MAFCKYIWKFTFLFLKMYLEVRETETERDLSICFHPQMPVTARTGTGLREELGTSSGLLGIQTWTVSCSLPGTLAGAELKEAGSGCCTRAGKATSCSTATLTGTLKSRPLHFQPSSMFLRLEKQQTMSQMLGPDLHMGDLKDAPGFLLAQL